MDKKWIQGIYNDYNEDYAIFIVYSLFIFMIIHFILLLSIVLMYFLLLYCIFFVHQYCNHCNLFSLVFSIVIIVLLWRALYYESLKTLVCKLGWC